MSDHAEEVSHRAHANRLRPQLAFHNAAFPPPWDFSRDFNVTPAIAGGRGDGRRNMALLLFSWVSETALEGRTPRRA